MKLKLKNTAEQIELVKAMGSRDNAIAAEANQAFAAFLGPVVAKVLMQAATASAIYTDLPYDEDDRPSIPLDLWFDGGEGYVTTWSQNVAGGLPTSTVEGFCNRLHKTLVKELKYAWVWGTSVKHNPQKVGKDH